MTVRLFEPIQIDKLKLSNRIIILAANPGRIAHEVTVDLSYPRTAETRLSTDYLKRVADVSRLLADRTAWELITLPQLEITRRPARAARLAPVQV